jgi:photosystem II stability/assembly factor-like uncharacterized protein
MMAPRLVCSRMAGVLLWVTVTCMQAQAQTWTQTDWSGGPAQLSWDDSTMYYSANFVDGWVTEGDLRLHVNDTSWINTGDLVGAMSVWSLLEASDGALYAGTRTNGDVFKSVDDGTTWVNTGELAGAFGVEVIIEHSDGALYAGTHQNGDVFKSIDAGTTWVNTGDLAGVPSVWSLLEAPDGALYAGTGPDNAHVFKSVDAGTTWTDMASLPSASTVYSLIEAQNATLYAATEGAGDVYVSVDAGTSWANTGELAGAFVVFSLIETDDEVLYGGTSPDGNVFKSVDAGTTWTNTGELTGVYHIYSVMQAADGVLYAGTNSGGAVGNVFKSVDAGTTWTEIAQPPGASQVLSVIQSSDGLLFAATAPSGDVFKTGYFLIGDLVSSVYEIENASVTYGTMTWNETPNGQIVSMLVRTDTLPDMSTAMDWDTCPTVVNGQDISDLASVDDFEQYIQYRVELVTARSDVTPILHEVSIEYELVGVEEKSASDPSFAALRLLQNRPNPFSGRTVISYSLQSATDVTLDVYDLSGRLVRTLVNGTKSPGIHRALWNANGRSAGLYFCRLRTGDFESTRKMVVIK